jgi:hypothetical protein
MGSRRFVSGKSSPNGRETPWNHGFERALSVYEDRGTFRPRRNPEIQSEVHLLGSRHFKLDLTVKGIRTALAEGKVRAVLNPP